MDAITACHEILASPENLRRIVSEVVEDAAAEGAVWPPEQLSLWRWATVEPHFGRGAVAGTEDPNEIGGQPFPAYTGMSGCGARGCGVWEERC
jgi:hypothetical protein